MNGEVQDLAATALALEYDRPIAVSVVSKLNRFPFLQSLAYNAQLAHLQRNFLSLEDFYSEMELYSSSSPLLKAAWNLIRAQVPLNLDMARNLIVDPVLGPVGNLFAALIGFDQTFAVDPEQLLSSTGSAVVSQNT